MNWLLTEVTPVNNIQQYLKYAILGFITKHKFYHKLNKKIMKNSILYMTSIFLLTATILISCQSSDKKVKNAEDDVQEAKKELADSKMDLYEVRLDTISNYEQFKIEAEKLIVAQEKNIADLKAKITKEKKGVKQDYEKTLVALENKNNELKKKLTDFKDDGKDNWISFKSEFNHDMDELGKAFKGLTINNKQ